ncbi:hypothetical protein AB4Z51_42715, partial [Bradyrhizobium sp. 2TAF36]|uniref:hypothetical protein n=1 Tax=Bradyrhizobium sp. 2TAF36 TaxID=3233016 RepID=UPI003F939AD3
VLGESSGFANGAPTKPKLTTSTIAHTFTEITPVLEEAAILDHRRARNNQWPRCGPKSNCRGR